MKNKKLVYGIFAVIFMLAFNACPTTVITLPPDDEEIQEESVLLKVEVNEHAAEGATNDPFTAIYDYTIEIRQTAETAPYYSTNHMATAFPLEIPDLVEGPAFIKIVAKDENHNPLAVESYFEVLVKGENNIKVDITWSESGYKLFINQTIEETPAVTAPDFLTVIGLPINLFEAKTGADVNKSASLFNISANSIIRLTSETTGWAPYTQTSTAVDKYIKNIHRNTSTSVNAGLNLGTFSGGITSSWGNSSSVNEEGMFLEFRSRSIIAEEYIQGGASPEFWIPYFNPNALNDIRNQSAGWFLDNYGSHIIHQAEYGVFARMCYTHLESHTTTTTDMKAGFEAQYKIFSAGASQSSSTEATEFRNKTTLDFVTYGGTADFMTDADFYAGYQDWFANAVNSPGYIGSSNTGYLAIWTILLRYADIHADDAIRQKAEEIRYEFYSRAFERMTEWEWIIGTETRLTNLGEIRSHFIAAGGDIIPKQIVVYLFGAGGGGQGAGYYYNYIGFARWGPYSSGGGAGGGSGGATRFGFIFTPEKPTDYMQLTYYIGRGGAGGGNSERSGPGQGGGNRGGNGEGSWIEFNLHDTLHTFSVNGGHGGGDNIGGIGGTSYDNPNPSLFNLYIPENGENGNRRNSQHGGGGGAGIPLDNYTAGTGGNGGSNIGGGHAGGNGLIVIREITLD